MAKLIHVGVVLFSILASVNQVWGCTAFSFSKDGKIYAARSYDWRVKEGLIVKNPKGQEKTAYMSGNRRQGEPARWSVRFGSIGFNQYGREFPVGGMNAAGLVVEGLLVYGTIYPAGDQRGIIQQGQWVQYLLDSYASVPDALAGIDTFRIVSVNTPFVLHFFLADEKGRSAVIEYIDGKKRIFTDGTLTATVLTNCPYSVAVDSLKDRSADRYRQISVHHAICPMYPAAGEVQIRFTAGSGGICL